jgi:hypothetical protein
VYRGYEIDTGVIEALNSVERRAAIETGQEQANVNLTGQISAKSIALSKVMTIPELEALEAKMLAAMEQERQTKAIADAGWAEADKSRGGVKEEGQEPPRNWRRDETMADCDQFIDLLPAGLANIAPGIALWIS